MQRKIHYEGFCVETAFGRFAFDGADDALGAEAAAPAPALAAEAATGLAFGGAATGTGGGFTPSTTWWLRQ